MSTQEVGLSELVHLIYDSVVLWAAARDDLD